MRALTYRAWSARQGVNGTEGLDTTRGTGVDSDEEEGAVCTICREKCRQVQGEQAPQAEAGHSDTSCAVPVGNEIQRGRKEERCEACWERAFNRRRLDGVVIDQDEQRITIIEVKRTSDRKEDYWERADMRATERYAALEQGLTECLEGTGWGLQRVYIVVGTESVNVEKWNEAMAKLAIIAAKGYMGWC